MNKKIKLTLFFSILPFVPFFASARGVEQSGVKVTDFTSSLLLVVVVAGLIINLLRTTQRYGGIIGNGIRKVGVGMIFLSVEALDRAAQSLGNAGFVAALAPDQFVPVVHDLFLVIALFFVVLGYAKLYSGTVS